MSERAKVLKGVQEKVMAGQRIGPDEGLYLLQRTDLLDLASLANAVRFRLHPEKVVTFVVDTNPNYTNVCETGCLFCAFHRKPTDPDAYTRSVEEVMAKIEWAARQGATTVLLQGGHNSDLPLDYYLDLVRTTRRRFPGVAPHFFSATEVREMARVSGLSVREVLEKLKEAGQHTLPGGGAEILTDRVRRRISPKKGSVDEWVEVHRVAHQLGYKTTATMMYGHLETPEDIVQHLEVIRRLQDETDGFTAFIPWSFKPANTRLWKWVQEPAGPNQYLRIIALARVYLDNFPHIQASWFSEGKKTGQVALHFGADDLGGTLIEENVHKAAGYVNTTTLDEVLLLIREAGFRPAQRTTLYEMLRYF
ncbi:MAG: cyclic dehypoxanthinyl futalosine synthase [Chloroflexota bacterium]|nr:cyclic dehypoxanthinyl futalosine synthase [Chloroflexota bacterium]